MMGAHINQNTRLFKPRECECCHKPFQPSNAVHLWCAECAPNQFFRQRLSTFGVGKPQFDAMMKTQENLCAICGEPFNPEHVPGENHKKPYPCLDHDHGTGLPRGLLCLRCNTRLGSGSSPDELKWLRAAIRYVMMHHTVLLDTSDPNSQDLLWRYAERQRSTNPGFAEDLQQALKNQGYVPDTSTDEFKKGVEAAARAVEGHCCVSSCCDAQPGGMTAKELAECVRKNTQQ